MSLEGLGLVQVNGVHLRTVFMGVLNMVSQQLTQSSKLSLSRVMQAEIESLMSGRLVHDLQPGVVLQNFEDSAIRLPQKLEPWCHNGSVCSIFGLFAGHSGKEESLGSLGGFQVIDVSCRLIGCTFKRRLNLFGFVLSLRDFCLSEFDEFLEHQLNHMSAHISSPESERGLYLYGTNVGILSDVLVLVETIFCGFSFSKVDTEFNEQEHNRLQ